MNEVVDRVTDAYSRRDDIALAEALEKLKHWMFNLFLILPPTTAMGALQVIRSRIQSILNKICAEAERNSAERLACVAGCVSAFWAYFDSLTNHQETDEANASLSKSDNKALTIRLTLLKCCFTCTGTRSTELVNTAAKFSRASPARVKFHLSRLIQMRLLERHELGRKAVYYRVTRLGESVLARRAEPYQIALFCIDMAACDTKMRAAMRDEIRCTWPTNG
ncbi:MAG: hypothetical protein KGJ93_03020 [Patescibacteria group bacterium]|nr:hypothetical protein [Patescibacteria group bacterium]